MGRRTPSGTPAIVALTAAGIPFTARPYVHDDGVTSYGLEAALSSVADRSQTPVTLSVDLDGRLPDAVAAWAESHGKSGQSYTEVVQSPEIEKLVAGYVEELNSKLNRWETIKKWKVLPNDLSIESGELTPSLKVKRKVVEKKYAGLLDKMYSGAIAD